MAGPSAREAHVAKVKSGLFRPRGSAEKSGVDYLRAPNGIDARDEFRSGIMKHPGRCPVTTRACEIWYTKRARRAREERARPESSRRGQGRGTSAAARTGEGVR